MPRSRPAGPANGRRCCRRPRRPGRRPSKVAEALADREQVGQRLAGMLAQGQAVDHRDAAWAASSTATSWGPVRTTIASTKRSRLRATSRDALAGTQDHVVGQVDRVAAELGRARLERHPGAQAGLLEEHRQRPPGEPGVVMAAIGPELRLELGREVEAAPSTSERDRSATLEQIASSQELAVDIACWRSCARRRLATSASCTGAPCGPASGRTSCVPSSAGRG